MSNADSSLTLPAVQIDPNPYHAALVTCHSSHSVTRHFEDNSRLYVTTDGAFVVHTEEGTYPVRGVVLCGIGLVRLESEDWRVVDGEHPYTEWYSMNLYISDVAWKAAMNFALTLPRPSHRNPAEISVWELPVNTATYHTAELEVA